MYVATIIPIARGIPFDSLTYYCPQSLTEGTLVTVPFGKQIITGIVSESTPLTEAKSLIKSAAFSLKKIKTIIGHLSYFERVIEAWKTTSQQTLAPIGAIAGATMPHFLFEYLQSKSIDNYSTDLDGSQKNFNESVQVAETKDRADQYKRLIRNQFAKKRSVFFVAPTIKGLEQWKSILEKGIQKDTIIITSKTTKKNLKSAIALLKENERPLLVFVTPGYFLLPRKDLGLVIVENESSSSFKTQDRYSIDLRLLIKNFCQSCQLDLVWGDSLPRLETLERLNCSHLPRSYAPQSLHVVPTDPYKTALSQETIELIAHSRKKNYKLFVFTNRKGLAPVSRCADCGTIVACPSCGLPVVLRNRIVSGKVRERYFICTHCTTELPANHLCVNCNSWNINSLMIGTESLSEEIAKLVGGENVFTIDDDAGLDNSSIEKLLNEINQKKFAIIVGITKIMPYLKNITYTLFPYFDRLLSIPSLYTTESCLRLVLECGQFSSKGVVIFTRAPSFPFIKKIEAQKINKIIEDELELRRDLQYPPFGLLIKISITSPEGHHKKIIKAVEENFSDIDISALPPRRISAENMKVLLVWIIKSEISYLEDEGPQILNFLNSLKYPYKIEQNPERF